jgi:hypothetical protein
MSTQKPTYAHAVAWHAYVQAPAYASKASLKELEEKEAPATALFEIWREDEEDGKVRPTGQWFVYEKVTCPVAIKSIEDRFASEGWGKP